MIRTDVGNCRNGLNVLIPTPTRLLQLAILGSTTFGFFKFFRVEGLDHLALSLRENATAQLGWGEGAPMPSNPWSTSSSQTPFPSTTAASPWPIQQNLQNENSTPLNSNALPSTNSRMGEERWVNAGNGAHVQNAKFSASPNAIVSPQDLVHRESKITMGAISLNQLDRAMLRDPIFVDRLVQVLSDFTCIAVQNVNVHEELLMPELMRALNQNGRWYEYIIGNNAANDTGNGLAIIFDAESLEADRNQTYSLRDETGVLRCVPLVAWFRAKGEVPRDAFTFTFVNAHLVDVDGGNQADFLPDMLSSIASDGRNEDDIVIAGSVCKSSESFQTLERQGCKLLLDESRDSKQGMAMFLSPMCREFKGKNGTMNLLRRYNLTPQEANLISEYAPVWAEFSTAEADIF